ncbi:MAG: DedA family protein [Haloarculaceae archaeon]
MFEWLSHAVLGFVRAYGYVAVFVYMVLETAFILHFVPSEVVVPFAASQLVHDPLSFVLFVVDTTVGATLGSLLAYVLFGRYGERVLERYGHLIHVTERDIERSRTVFIRYGESSVFWARMLPLFRALISIPAGLAEMGLRRFTLYSAAGAALFNTALTYLVYSGAGTHSPLDYAVEWLRAGLGEELAFVASHVLVVFVVLALLAGLAAGIWMARGWIRMHPELAKLFALHVVRLVGLFVGVVFVLGALSAPQVAFRLLTGVWNDPLLWVHLGFSEQIALLLTGVLVAFVATFVYEVGRVVQIAQVAAAVESTVARLRP